jgi:hypothetical protein
VTAAAERRPRVGSASGVAILAGRLIA